MTTTPQGNDTPPCRGRCHEGARRPPAVTPGRQLCASCRDRVEEDLVDLAELYELSTFALELGNDGRGTRAGARCPQGLDFDHVVVAAQADGLAMLLSWCGVVAGARGVRAPDRLCVRRLTTFLAIHLDWLTGHPSAAEFADEMDELASTLRDTLRPAGSGLVRDRLD